MTEDQQLTLGMVLVGLGAAIGVLAMMARAFGGGGHGKASSGWGITGIGGLLFVAGCYVLFFYQGGAAAR